MLDLLAQSLLTVALVAGQPGAATGERQAIVYQFPKDTDSYFVNNLLTASDFLHFEANGRYRKISQTDLGSEEVSERGTWKQQEDGEIFLLSDRRYRDVVAGPLQVWVGDPGNLPDLQETKDKIVDFLRNTQDEEIDSARVEGIRTLRFGSGAIHVDVGVEEVSRSQLEALIQEIDLFLASGEKNRFRLTPYEYRSQVFLVWKDSKTSINRNKEEMMEMIDRIIEKRRSATISFYRSISEKGFYDSTSTVNRVISSFFDLFR